MNLKAKELLKNKTVLYVVSFLSLTNILSYFIKGNWNALIIFAAIGLIVSYFNKNMIIVLSIALFVTNTLITLNYINNVKEGLENKKEEEEEKKSEIQEKKSEIDYAATISEAYDNLDKLIGADGVKKMTEHTAELAKKQKELMKNLENMQPIMAQAGDMLKNLNLGDNNLQSIIDNMLNKKKM